VNVGGDSAIRRVTVTGKNIADIIVTAKKLASRPSGVTPVDIPVYQYIDVVPARYTVISHVQIEFEIPLESTGDHNTTGKAVSLNIFHNGTWVTLPTSATGTRNGMAHYRAESPEFSLFAITIRNNTYRPSQKSVFTKSPDPETIPGDETREPGIPAIPKTPKDPLVPVASASGRAPMPFLAGIAGISVIVTGAVLIRWWWIRGQNPPSK
jgi:PGF-pre-PGF domain-containing protein